jgi:recombination protein RecR
MSEPIALRRLRMELTKLPGIGDKTATRLAYFILKQPAHYAQGLSLSIAQAKEQLTTCKLCLTFCERDLCDICQNPHRNKTQICIIEKPSDSIPLETMNIFNGTYHVLHGLLKPLDGITPEDLSIQDLQNRIQQLDEKDIEVIFALACNMEGQTTSHYIRKQLPSHVHFTQLAQGIPLGSAIEYVDSRTLQAALENRTELK